jgi:hypothetical protein
MSVPPVPPAPDGARFDRAIDSLEFHNQRLERLRAIFPSFKKIYVGMLELIAANTGDLAAEKREVVAAKPAPEPQAESNGRAEAHAKSNGHGRRTARTANTIEISDSRAIAWRRAILSIRTTGKQAVRFHPTPEAKRPTAINQRRRKAWRVEKGLQSSLP